MSWGCQMRSGKGAPYVLNGIIARRNEPTHRVEHMRHERALRVLRDDSGTLSNQQARSPLFVVRPGAFWATFFDRTESGATGTQRMLILKVKTPGGAGSAELFAGRASKPSAKGKCITRLEQRPGS
jgi:hypothetical protein